MQTDSVAALINVYVQGRFILNLDSEIIRENENPLCIIRKHNFKFLCCYYLNIGRSEKFIRVQKLF